MGKKRREALKGDWAIESRELPAETGELTHSCFLKEIRGQTGKDREAVGKSKLRKEKVPREGLLIGGRGRVCLFCFSCVL